MTSRWQWSNSVVLGRTRVHAKDLLTQKPRTRVHTKDLLTQKPRKRVEGYTF